MPKRLDDDRYWWLYLEPQNVADVLINVATTVDRTRTVLDPDPNQLIGIVDDKAGGIIAYAIGEGNAADIISALREQNDA